MKLLHEDEEHLLPDAPRTPQLWYVRLTKKSLTWLFSAKGLTISIGVLLMAVLTGIISLSYLDVSRNVDRNGIALRDFDAEFQMTITDTDATREKIDEAMQAMEPIYQPAEPHNRDILEGHSRLLQQLGTLAQGGPMPLEAKREQFMQLASGTPGVDEIFNRYFTHPISAAEWQEISTASKRTLQRILKKGFAETDEPNREERISQEIPRYGYNRSYRDLVFFTVDSALEPNLIVDERAMEERRSALATQIQRDEPATHTYNKGERIVSKGQRVTPLQMAALAKMGKSASGNNWVACLGVFLLCMLFVFNLWSYLYNFRERQYFRPAYAALVATLSIITVAFLQMLDHGAIGMSWPIFIFPMAAYALTLAVFTHPRVAIIATTLLAMLVALSMRVDFYHLSALLFGSFMGIYILSRRISFSDRSQLMYAGLYVGATNALILMALSLLRPNFGGVDYFTGLMAALGGGFFSGVFSGMLTIGSLPLLEKIFRLVTPFTLMELGNHDQPLLKRMQFEAPGTFHHSIMVASLAEAAAEAIGANALLTRVGCLYHDIGKMKRPLFFIENQAYFGVENPHDKLSPRLSKMVITAHPRDSIEMAKQHKLPECLMKFMTEHHGTLTAGYFYNKACMEEGAENVNKSQFRYPGPKPGSKETAIVMLADACESAVRALKNPTVAQVEERIDKIIEQRIEDGQFDNCPITFKDIHIIKQTFVRVLRGIQHNRIEYQQNMMRELGRKLPASTVTEHTGLQEALRQVHDQQAKQEGNG